MTIAKYWGVALCCLPFYMRISSVASPRYAKDLLFIATGLFSLVIFGIGKNIKSPTQRLALILIPVAFFSLRNIGSSASIYQLLCFMVGAGVFIQLSGNFKKSDEVIILNAVGIAVIIESLMVILNGFGIDLREYYAALFGAVKHQVSSRGWVQSDGIVMAGSFDNPNLTTSFLAIGMASLWRDKWVYFVPLCLIAIILCGGVSSYFVILAAGVFYFARKLKSEYITGLVALSAVGFVGLIYYLPSFNVLFSDGGRLAAWEWALANLDMPGWFFGKGLGYWTSTSPMFIINGATKHHDQLHNEYIEFLYAFGALGCAGVCFCIYESMDRARKCHPSIFAMGAAVAASCCVHFTFHIAATAAVGIVVAALLTRTNDVC